MKKTGLLILSLTLLFTACAPTARGSQLASVPQSDSAPWGITPLPVVEIPGAKDQPQQTNLVPEKSSLSKGCFEGECHQSIVIEAGQFLHDPFAQGICDPCHLMAEDHTVSNSPHQASQQDIDLCMSCHEESSLGRSHPVDEDRIDPITGSLFTCTSSCHNPHSAPYPYLLRLPGGGSLCVRCHEEFN